MYSIHDKILILKNKKSIYWRYWDLNPGLSACEADTLPLSYTPSCMLCVLHKLNGTILLFES